MPYLGFLIAGAIMLVARIVLKMPPNISLFDFGTPWAVYDIFATLLVVAGIVGLVIRLLLILKVK